MPEFAKQVKVETFGSDRCELTIDGKPFPWFIAKDGIKIEPGTPATVTLTIFANDVEIVPRPSP